MRGLLIKDLYIARSNILVTIVSLIALGFGLSFLLEPSMLLIVAPPCATTAVFVSITSDASSKWSKNVITMPVSRDQIIGEKFILYIVLSLLGTVAALIPCGALAILGFEMEAGSLCLYGSMGISASLLAGGLSLPCAYRFDPDKSQVVFMLSFMASTAIIFALVVLINLFIPVKENALPAFGVVLAVSVVFFLVSNRPAVWLFRQKELF